MQSHMTIILTHALLAIAMPCMKAWGAASTLGNNADAKFIMTSFWQAFKDISTHVTKSLQG